MRTHIAIIFCFLMVNCLSAQVVTFEDVLKLQSEGKYKKALKALDEVMANESPKAFHYNQKAYLLAKTQELNQAIEVLKNGIEIMPDSLKIYNMLGEIYTRRKRFDEALDLCQQAYIHSNTPKLKADYLAMIGGILSHKREFNAAKNALERALLLDSTNLNIYNNLANVYGDLGDTEESLRQLKRIIAIDPNYIMGYINIGYALQEKGRFDESLSYFDRAIEIKVKDVSLYGYAYCNRSFSKLKLKDLEGAMADVNKSLTFFPSNSYAYKVRALIHLEHGKTKAACKDLQTAIDWKYTEEFGPEVKMLLAKHCN